MWVARTLNPSQTLMRQPSAFELLSTEAPLLGPANDKATACRGRIVALLGSHDGGACGTQNSVQGRRKAGAQGWYNDWEREIGFELPSTDVGMHALRGRKKAARQGRTSHAIHLVLAAHAPKWQRRGKIGLLPQTHRTPDGSNSCDGARKLWGPCGEASTQAVKGWVSADLSGQTRSFVHLNMAASSLCNASHHAQGAWVSITCGHWPTLTTQGPLRLHLEFPGQGSAGRQQGGRPRGALSCLGVNLDGDGALTRNARHRIHRVGRDAAQ